MITSLKKFETINGKGIITNDQRPHTECGSIDWEAFDELRETHPISIDHEKDMISFKIMTKPASEGGNILNAQWVDLVATGLEMLKFLNAKFPCRENAITITKLEEALMWQEKRTQDRINRGVEGQNKQ